VNQSIDCTSERDFSTRDAEGHVFFGKKIIENKRKATNGTPVAKIKM
jgi:hypothetical protein